MLEPVSLTPIGIVVGPRVEPTDDAWGDIESTIALDEAFPAEALRGLAEFSHLEVVYLFHLADPAATTTGARRPRGLAHLPEVGVFAQRNKDRPNHIGVSRCEILGVTGREVRVRGLDAIDGTPVLDLKPHFSAFVPKTGAVREPAWVAEITREYF